MELNLADLFERVADRVGEREAVVGNGRRLTYAQLDDRTTRLAHGLAATGIGPGDHVGLDLYSTPEHLEAMLACYKLRAVPVNVNYRYTADELAYLAADADLAALLYQPELGEPVARLAAAPPPELNRFVEVGGGGSPIVAGALAFEDLVATGGAARDFETRSADDHYILYTLSLIHI